MEVLGLLSWVGLSYVLMKRGGGRVSVFFFFFSFYSSRVCFVLVSTLNAG